MKECIDPQQMCVLVASEVAVNRQDSRGPCTFLVQWELWGDRLMNNNVGAVQNASLASDAANHTQAIAYLWEVESGIVPWRSYD